MAMELKQSPRLQTQLVITPALKQAIELLQVSRLELITMVKKELEENRSWKSPRAKKRFPRPPGRKRNP